MRIRTYYILGYVAITLAAVALVVVIANEYVVPDAIPATEYAALVLTLTCGAAAILFAMFLILAKGWFR